MKHRLVLAASLTIASVMHAAVAWAQIAPAPALPIAAAVVADANPSCKASRTRCVSIDGTASATTDISGPTKAVTPHLRELRACLDRAAADDVAATASLRWAAGDPTKPVVDMAAPGSEAQRTCVERSAADLGSVSNNGALSLRCAYECERPDPSARPNTAVGPLPVMTPAPRPAEDLPHGESWYGWQTLIADGASIGVLAIGLMSWTVESTVAGYAGFLLTTPVIHAVHGNLGTTIGSLALRIFAPAFTGAIGAGGVVFSSDKGDLESVAVVTGAGVGMAVGAAVCTALDAAVFSFAKPDQRKTGSAAPATGSAPTFGLRLGSTVSVAGAF